MIKKVYNYVGYNNFKNILCYKGVFKRLELRFNPLHKRLGNDCVAPSEQTADA